jgi:hypothetical protein
VGAPSPERPVGAPSPERPVGAPQLKVTIEEEADDYDHGETTGDDIFHNATEDSAMDADDSIEDAEGQNSTALVTVGRHSARLVKVKESNKRSNDDAHVEHYVANQKTFISTTDPQYTFGLLPFVIRKHITTNFVGVPDQTEQMYLYMNRVFIMLNDARKHDVMQRKVPDRFDAIKEHLVSQFQCDGLTEEEAEKKCADIVYDENYASFHS